MNPNLKKVLVGTGLVVSTGMMVIVLLGKEESVRVCSLTFEKDIDITSQEFMRQLADVVDDRKILGFFDETSCDVEIENNENGTVTKKVVNCKKVGGTEYKKNKNTVSQKLRNGYYLKNTDTSMNDVLYHRGMFNEIFGNELLHSCGVELKNGTQFISNDDLKI